MNEFNEQDWDIMKKNAFDKCKNNINNLSYWFPKIKKCGIKVPETLIIPIDYEKFKWLISDNYKDNEIKELGIYIQEHIEKSPLKDKKKLFIKNGTFSNKFQFNTCKVEDINAIGNNFLSVSYASMCMGAGEPSEIVVREFLESDANIKTIYNGMPLNTEFRVFYDFDKRKLLGIFNYWDKNAMIDGLKYDCFSKDLTNFLSYTDVIEKNFNEYKDEVVKIVASAMNKVDLNGSWSVDIMLLNGEFYLIDMATAKTSYYYEKLQ